VAFVDKEQRVFDYFVEGYKKTLPKNFTLKQLKIWCTRGSYGLPKKPWTEYLKEYGLYYLSEKSIVKAMEEYHEGHGKYPFVKSGDVSKYIGFKITWGAINQSLYYGYRGLPGGSSLSQLRKKHITGIEPDLTEEVIAKAMKDYHEEHGKYPWVKSGDAKKYFGFKITWKAIEQCLKKGNRGLPGGSSLAKLRKEHITGKETPLTEDLIVKALKNYHEDHAKYPVFYKGEDALKYIGFKIKWSAIDACLRLGHRGLSGGSTLAQLKKKYSLL